MNNDKLNCEAYQVSSQMNCDKCNLVWDMNDIDPPRCRKENSLKEEWKAASKNPYYILCWVCLLIFVYMSI